MKSNNTLLGIVLLIISFILDISGGEADLD